MDGVDDANARALVKARRESARHATLAIVRLDQLSQLDPELPLDDFAVHPMATEELVARLRRAVKQREGEDSSHLLRCGDLTINQASYQVFVGRRAVDLTYKEYELLKYLASNPGRVFSRESLLRSVWEYDYFGGTRTVDVHIRRLRSKIDDVTYHFIETQWNVGYRFRSPTTAA
ncbi:MAG: winged helix-turn-helix domain-containing protein [Pseudomonadales bacterium]